MKTFRLAAVLAVAAAGLACSSTPPPQASWDHNVSFAGWKTFAWYADPQEDKGIGSAIVDTRFVDDHVKKDVTALLVKKGFSPAAVVGTLACGRIALRSSLLSSSMILAYARPTCSSPTAGTHAGVSCSVCFGSGDVITCIDGASRSMDPISPDALLSMSAVRPTLKRRKLFTAMSSSFGLP